MVTRDLNYVTFIIPVRIDHDDRLKNLDIVLCYLVCNFRTNIIVHEEGTKKCKSICEKYKVRYINECYGNSYLHRTRQLNEMILDVSSEIVVNYDVDVLLEPAAYIEASEYIKNNDKTVVLPYSGYCYDVPESKKDLIFLNSNLNDIDVHNDCELMSSISLGGVIFFKTNDYIYGGMENERFKSWGYEDNERIERFKKIGFYIHRLNDYCIYHLSHYRTSDSNESNAFYFSNEKEYKRIVNMDTCSLIDEINGWY